MTPEPMTRPRWAWLDGMRGLALGGIALVNLTWFTGYAVLDEPGRQALFTAPIDPAVRTVIHVLVDAKLYSVFALLFGVGYGLVRRRLGPAGWTRRMIVLLGLGGVHASLIWFGDILSLYALVGLALPLTDRLTSRRLLWVAVACLGAPVLQTLLWPPLAQSLGPPDSLLAFAQGDLYAVLAANVEFLRVRWLLALDEGRLFKLLGMFMLGVWAERRGLVARPQQNRRSLDRVAVLGLAIGLPVELVRASLSLEGPTAVALAAVGVPVLAVGYAATLTRFPVTWTAPAGRMSLSLYLLQSLVGISLGYGVGLGGVGLRAWGQLGPALIVVIAAAQLGLMVALARMWLRRFERGPVERLWRWLARGENKDEDEENSPGPRRADTVCG